MKFGASMFFTDYSMTPAALGRALEERGSIFCGRRNIRIFRLVGRHRSHLGQSCQNVITTLWTRS